MAEAAATTTKPATPPSPAPQPISARSITSVQDVAITVKGLTRAGTDIVFGIPATAAAGTTALAGYFASSILQILFAGLFDKNNPFFKHMQDNLAKCAQFSLDKGQQVFLFAKDQAKEAICEAIFNEEDFKHIDPAVAQAIKDKKKEIKNKIEKRPEQEILDDIDAQAVQRNTNEFYGLNQTTGKDQGR
jgi:hypothetical protein